MSARSSNSRNSSQSSLNSATVCASVPQPTYFTTTHRSNVAVRQLFHELKAQYPALPDNVINQYITKFYHNRENCTNQITTDKQSDDKLTSKDSRTIRQALTRNPLESILVNVRESLNKVSQASKLNVCGNTRNNNKYRDNLHIWIAQIAQIKLTRDNNRYNFGSDSNIWAASSGRTSALLKTLRSPHILRRNSFDDNLPKLVTISQQKPLTCALNRPTTLNIRKPLNDIVNKDNVTRHAECQTSSCENHVIYSPTVNVSLNVNLEITSPSSSSRGQEHTHVNVTVTTPTTSCQNYCSPDESSDSPHLSQLLQITVGQGRSITRPNSSYTCAISSSPVVLGTRAESLPNLNCDMVTFSSLIKRQLERKRRLEIALITERKRLTQMKLDVTRLLATGVDSVLDALASKEMRLRHDIRVLLDNCQQLTDEVDRRAKSSVPLGETSEEFYKNIYTGQRGRLIRVRAHDERSSTSSEGEAWTCHMCTLKNHPLLNNCEVCHMPRVGLGKLRLPAIPLPHDHFAL